MGVFCCPGLLPKRFERDLNPFGNKIFIVEFMQLAQRACKLLLSIYERQLQALFSFYDEIQPIGSAWSLNIFLEEQK